MRRLAAFTALFVGIAALAAVLLSASAQGSSTSSFDVIFDDARGLIGGQLVKVAGAQAGSIQNVVVVKQGFGAQTSYKAKIEASIDSQFMPFRTNATCTIRPQGLIAENYVECDPGSPPAPVLQGVSGQPPTVPVQNTSEPVSLLDLFNIFNVPTRERFALILNELGIGTAGEGQNFNDILYRANPALKLTDQVIGILARQRAHLATIVDATNTIAQEGASHTGDVQSFLDQAAALSSTTASHSSNLALAINRLPGLLAAAQPSLQQLDTVAVDGTPLVQQIHAAVPSLNRLATTFPVFVKAAKPGLAKLGAAARRAVPAIKAVTPLVGLIKSYLQRSLPGTEQIGKLFENLQQHGFVENFMSVLYYASALFARFDGTSHLGVAYLVDPSGGPCEVYATTPTPGCDRHFGPGPTYTPNAAARAAAAGASQRPARRASGASPAASPLRVGAPSSGSSTGAPATAGSSTSGSPTPSSAAPGSSAPPQQPGSGALQNLLNYLFK